MANEEGVRSPYVHMKQGAAEEAAGNLRGAEAQWLHAVRSADSLPLAEYRRSMRAELVRYSAEPAYESKPGVTEAQLRKAYSEVLALPFLARLELASFYARYGAYPEAKEACEQAFAFKPDEICLQDVRVKQLWKRAELMALTLEEMIGPEQIEELFAKHFAQLDRDHNGYVHHEELEQAQFDLSLPAECQLLIRHLLCHYFEVEAAHDDEWGIDIKGISQRDVQAFAKEKRGAWKRLKRSPTTSGGNPKHVW